MDIMKIASQTSRKVSNIAFQLHSQSQNFPTNGLAYSILTINSSSQPTNKKYSNQFTDSHAQFRVHRRIAALAASAIPCWNSRQSRNSPDFQAQRSYCVWILQHFQSFTFFSSYFVCFLIRWVFCAVFFSALEMKSRFVRSSIAARFKLSVKTAANSVFFRCGWRTRFVLHMKTREKCLASPKRPQEQLSRQKYEMSISILSSIEHSAAMRPANWLCVLSFFCSS